MRLQESCGRLLMQRLVVDVEVGERQRVQALAHEEVGGARELDQRVGPLGVAREGDHLAAQLDAQAE